MRKISFALFTLFFTFSLYSQTINEAVRYSTFDIGGTARTIGIGGGIGALGADFSVLSTNPAGLASFRRSEFTFTPTLVLSKSDAAFLEANNGETSENKTRFNFNNLGVVVANLPYNSNLRTSNFGIGINRLADYHQEIFYEGTSLGTVTDRWLELANGSTLDQLDNFEGGLAYDALAIYQLDPDNDPTGYVSDFIATDMILKNQSISRKGSMTELVISYAANIRERFSIGGTIGVPILSFEETKTYRESDPENVIPFFNELRFTERLTTTGAGINLKIGAIYRVHQTFRVGLAIHTPTSFGLEDNFTTEIAYDLDPNSGVDPEPPQLSPDGLFEYRIRTPWRIIGSAGLIIGKLGFVSGDIEWQNFANAKFNFNTDASPEDLAYEATLNEQIDNQLGSIINIRVGGELRYNIMRFRAGVNLRSNPFENADALDSVLSAGFGLRWENFFLDFALKRVMNNESYSPYVVFNSPNQNVEIDDIKNQGMMTLGVKF